MSKNIKITYQVKTGYVGLDKKKYSSHGHYKTLKGAQRKKANILNGIFKTIQVIIIKNILITEEVE